MIKRTLRLLGLPLLLLCWAPLALYPLVWLLAIPIGYIYSGNQWYFFKQHLQDPNSYHRPQIYNLKDPTPENYIASVGPPFLSREPLKNLWNWYWSEPKDIPRPTTF